MVSSYTSLTCPNKMEGLRFPRDDLDPCVDMVTHQVNDDRASPGGGEGRGVNGGCGNRGGIGGVLGVVLGTGGPGGGEGGTILL